MRIASQPPDNLGKGRRRLQTSRRVPFCLTASIIETFGGEHESRSWRFYGYDVLLATFFVEKETESPVCANGLAFLRLVNPCRG